MGRQIRNVHGRQSLHYSGRAGLPAARLQEHGVLRSRHSGSQGLDHTSDGSQRGGRKIQMRRSRRAKIVATLGPASYAPEMIERLFEAGVDVFRINMSHSSFDTVKKLHAAVRAAEARFERPIGILADLQGPKFRIGEIEGGSAMLAEGATYRFDARPSSGGPERVYLPHPQIFEAIEPGHTLLLDD